jgi:hypothetical protein
MSQKICHDARAEILMGNWKYRSSRADHDSAVKFAKITTTSSSSPGRKHPLKLFGSEHKHQQIASQLRFIWLSRRARVYFFLSVWLHTRAVQSNEQPPLRLNDRYIFQFTLSIHFPFSPIDSLPEMCEVIGVPLSIPSLFEKKTTHPFQVDDFYR